MSYICRLLFFFCFIQTIVDAQTIFFLKPAHILPAFDSSRQYFAQSKRDIPIGEVDESNFGLLPNYTWNHVVDSLASNEKLFFLQRHGEGWHNVARRYLNISYHDWQCHWSLVDGKDGIEWYDAELTPRGKKQVASLAHKIKHTDEFPFPLRFYVSPLRRTLQTWLGTWQNLTSKIPTIKENAREKYGIDSESKRHEKEYIVAKFPNEFTFEPYFSEFDDKWSLEEREKLQHCRYRAATLLRDIFKEVTDNEKVISVVSHSGIIYCILDVVQHRYYGLYTAGLIPVIVKMERETKLYPLDDAFSNFTDWCPSHFTSETYIEQMVSEKENEY